MVVPTLKDGLRGEGQEVIVQDLHVLKSAKMSKSAAFKLIPQPAQGASSFMLNNLRAGGISLVVSKRWRRPKPNGSALRVASNYKAAQQAIASTVGVGKSVLRRCEWI